MNISRIVKTVLQGAESTAARAPLEGVPALADTHPTDAIGMSRKAFFSRDLAPDDHAAAEGAKLFAARDDGSASFQLANSYKQLVTADKPHTVAERIAHLERQPGSVAAGRHEPHYENIAEPGLYGVED